MEPLLLCELRAWVDGLVVLMEEDLTADRFVCCALRAVADLNSELLELDLTAFVLRPFVETVDRVLLEGVALRCTL